ncbi:aldo/keto reductase [Erythrobacter sp. SCSIO 43205]|uniref:aldo/keto reductase n=1 Tax=Erythrobacter sp. SCSIO 43205 TaxID=2779361 RepID=UPI001CA85147|nr:aldo/keto reductase [Erythrobacter sp. SCSIO 43205]UAB79291.1 aldo/keto reductase [Erythrobacter sp. SCSIO 43205]
MSLQETYTLNNGVKIPKIGFGTWMIEDDKAAQAVSEALEVGYRHIDTAQAYENERGVGEGIANSSVPRDEIFVTTKLVAEIKSYDEAVEAIDGSLEKLGLDMIDMMIIHSPQPWEEFREGKHFFEGNLEAWRALEEALKAGKLRAIGVSNFEQVDLANILDNSDTPPAVNQVLAHIGNTPFDLIEYANEKNILTEAYSPFGHGEILERSQISEIAAKYDVSVPQLAVRYLLQLGLLPLPKTTTRDHMKNNAEVDFTISDTDFEALKALEPLEDYGDASDFPVYAKSRS